MLPTFVRSLPASVGTRHICRVCGHFNYFICTTDTHVCIYIFTLALILQKPTRHVLRVAVNDCISLHLHCLTECVYVCLLMQSNQFAFLAH